MNELFHFSVDEGQRNYLHMLLDDARADSHEEEAARIALRDLLHSAVPTRTATTSSDSAIAANINSLAEKLQSAVVDAANLGLDVDIDAQSVRMHSLGSAKAVPIWRVRASIARPL